MFTPKDMPNHPVKSVDEVLDTVEPTQDNLKQLFDAIEAEQQATKPEVKKPAFVRKPHLTDRPLKNNPDLIELKDKLVNAGSKK